MISRNSIAVLPFANISPDKDYDYFSDGISEEIINTLGRFDGLHVTSRTSSFSFKDQNIDIREIGKRLSVAYILEGSLRRDENRVRITAKLIKTFDGFQIWSDSWERPLSDVFALQDEMAITIAETINSRILPASTTKEHAIHNAEAIDLYLKGLYILNQYHHSRHSEIIEMFEKSYRLEPGFDKPLVGLCNVYTWLSSVGVIDPMEAQQKVDSFIKSLLSINRDIPEIYSLISGKYFWMDWNITLAYENINKALHLKPNYSEAMLQRGMVLLTMGKPEEALDNLFMTERLNPFDQNIHYCIGFVSLLTGEFEKAIEYFEKNLEILPYWSAILYGKTESLCQLERFDEAYVFLKTLEENPSLSDLMIPLWGMYYACCKNVEKTRYYLNLLMEEKRLDFGSPDFYYVAKILLELDQNDLAMDYAEKGMQMNSAPMLFAKLDYTWDPIRFQSRFKQMIKKLDYEDYALQNLKYRKSVLPGNVVAEIERKLEELMNQEKPWLNPRLSLPDLSEMIDVTINQLSQFLNDHLGKNFFDYANSFRLKYFQKISKDPKYSHLSILGLAYECGFNSKATFNTFFRKELGTTPSAWYKSVNQHKG